VNRKFSQRVLNILYLAEARRPGQGNGQEPVGQQQLDQLYDNLDEAGLLGEPSREEVEHYRQSAEDWQEGWDES
jgi:hypothetical protein